MKRLVSIVLAALLAVPFPVAAGSPCRYATCGQAQAYYPAQTYYAPAYQAPTYYNPYAAVVAKAYLVQVPLSAYTSVGDDVRNFYSTKQAVKEGILEGLREAQSSIGPAPTPTAPGPAPSVGIPPGASAGQPKQLVTVKAIFGARCASCHNPQDPKRVDLTGDLDRLSPTVAGYIATQITMGKMPKKGGPLPQDEFDIVIRWADERIAGADLHPPAPPAPPGLPKPPEVPMLPATKK